MKWGFIIGFVLLHCISFSSVFLINRWLNVYDPVSVCLGHFQTTGQKCQACFNPTLCCPSTPPGQCQPPLTEYSTALCTVIWLSVGPPTSHFLCLPLNTPLPFRRKPAAGIPSSFRLYFHSDCLSFGMILLWSCNNSHPAHMVHMHSGASISEGFKAKMRLEREREEKKKEKPQMDEYPSLLSFYRDNAVLKDWC